MASELPSKSKRRKTTQHTYSSETKANLRISVASVKHFTRICGHTIPEPTKVRDAYLTTLKASSTASSDVPPNYTYRLQPITCIHYNKQTQY